MKDNWKDELKRVLGEPIMKVWIGLTLALCIPALLFLLCMPH